MIKTIVVHIDGSARQSDRLRAAAGLANACDAHLIGSAVTGISWTNYALMAGTIGGGMPASDFKDLREDTGRRLEAFKEEARRLDVASYEARMVEDDVRYALLLQSRYADLVVVSQDSAPDPALPAPVRGLPEHLALHGPRPVLVIPDGWRGDVVPGTVVVGWDGGVQAIRAITGALPLLRRAQSVKLVLVNPDELSELHGEEPGADMALYLARHGVQVDVVVERTPASPGDTLLKVAANSGAGLIVAGAYGHSRYREWALGGATRDLLECAPVPVLLAH